MHDNENKNIVKRFKDPSITHSIIVDKIQIYCFRKYPSYATVSQQVFMPSVTGVNPPQCGS